MAKKLLGAKLKKHLYKLPILLTVLFLSAVGAVPLLVPQGNASALGQLTVRKLTISSGIPSATGVTYTYSFTTATTAAIQSIKFVVCTSATATYGLGSTSSTTGCTAPTGQNVNQGTQASLAFTNATGFTRVASTTGNCAPANNVLCVNRTQAANETAGAKSIGWNTQTNPSTANSTFYVGIYTYSDNAFATAVDSGTVASAVVQTLTVNAAVAEILQFCIGSTSVDDLVTAVGPCSGISGTSVNLGTLDPTAISVTPVAASSGGSNTNAVAVLRTNALNGSAVFYDAVQAGSGTNHLGTLRLTGANCNAGNISTDGCINAQGSTQGAFTAGTEDFGMTIAGVSCVTEMSYNGGSGYYTCAYSSGTEHLVPSSNYIGQTSAYGTSNGFAWVESGSSTQIASASSNNTVADEALIMKFAATPSITTPFGTYSVQVDYTAVPTY